MKAHTLRDLLVHEINDLHSAESQLIEALPEMIEAANDERLVAAFTKHLSETKQHLERLNDILKRLNEEPDGQKCQAMAGLLKEGAAAIKNDAEPNVQDAAIIAASQRVEHYEMAGYGCARTFARLLGEEEIAEILQGTLDEEGATDRKLTDIAMSGINQHAAEIA